MAKYAYAPLSVNENRRRAGMDVGASASGGGNGGGSGGNDGHQDGLVQERMPLCVGFCVLLAIVYVLSRTGDSDALSAVHTNDHNNIRSASSTNVVDPTAAVHQQQQQQQQEWTPTTTTTTSNAQAASSSSAANYAAPVRSVEEAQQHQQSQPQPWTTTATAAQEKTIAQQQPWTSTSTSQQQQQQEQHAVPQSWTTTAGSATGANNNHDTSSSSLQWTTTTTGQQQANPQEWITTGQQQTSQSRSATVPSWSSKGNTAMTTMTAAGSSSSAMSQIEPFEQKGNKDDHDCDCSSSKTTVSVDELNPQDASTLYGELRAKALERTPPHIIECAEAEAGESQAACHLPPKQRFAALGQKGATLWMTGCSGAGKTTIATALEEKLVKEYGKHVYRLDGDNLRTGLNRDLGFSEADRAESVRRTGELATLFADSGTVTIVGLISPYRADRDAVRRRHEDQNVPFYEVFLDVPVEELKKRDPKGQYARVESGELKHFTCIDDPYEEPLEAEITLKTHELRIEDSVNILFRALERDGILMGPPKVSPPGLPNPDGDILVDLHVPEHLRDERRAEAETLVKVLMTDLELNWLQTVGEGWASPLQGFMREGTLLETLHFNSILTDPFNLTGNGDRLERPTNFDSFAEHPPPNRVSMSVPITLACTSFTKQAIESSGSNSVALVTQMGQTVAILRNPEIYPHRKEEIVTRMFGVIDPDHPYVKQIYAAGDWLIGGEVELLDRIRYNDGLDVWRKTAAELYREFSEKGADTVYAFQTRNPTHAGHAYLMRSAGQDLRNKGYKNPVLWLSPLGGWTKPDDVPLDVRVKQHEHVLEAGLSHPGGLDPSTTVMAIWPAPMVYAGPTEVQFHAKSRRSGGASYFVVGRDPAGMKGSPNAAAHPDDDLYDGNHGRYVLQNSPGIGDMQMLSFVKVMYDVSDNVMKEPDPTRMDDFISISGTKMRLLARNGAVPCSPTDIPTDLVEANCIPAGFMVPHGWNQVVDYYKNVEDTERFIPWSRPRLPPPAEPQLTLYRGQFGSTSFQLISNQVESFWHDVPMQPSSSQQDDNVIYMVTEIPMYVTAKMEITKDQPKNPIAQDSNKDGSPRYYTYGVPFFNYGAIPQTWEDPQVLSPDGSRGGDNDPLDVLEFGSKPLNMGSVTPCRVLGSLELIDEGETDFKILCIALQDPDAARIRNVADLDRVKPGTMDKLRDWLKRYKTSDGKPENALAQEEPTSPAAAMRIIRETHLRWQALCGHDGTSLQQLSNSNIGGFWLDSPSCRGRGG